MADDVYSFGDWMSLRRQSLVLSREELARRVGVAEISIRKIEADERRPSPQVAALLAQQLQLAAETHPVFVQVARGLLTVDQLPPPIPGSTRSASTTPSTPAPAPLPSGTVTFLFTDIEASTRLWEQHPQAMPAALSRHDALVQQAIGASGGATFKTVGDAICAAFARAPDALDAALAAQQALQAEPWATTGPLRVRIALHTGAAEPRAGDYFGPPLNRVARLLACGHGGQILLSLAAEQLVREHLPPSTALRDLGMHRLKDLSYPEQIFQLIAPDLPTDFPALNTLNARRTNLPAQPTALIGREQDMVAVCAQLRRPEVRLLTLTGPGGTGKTRLGLQVAAELLDAFADGVYFVNLAPISDPALITSTIVQALGITETGDQPAQERLRSYLRDKQLLLLLDNFEQIVDAAPQLAELVVGCPQLTLLITSRVPLHLRGEKEIAVPPLALPPNLSLSRSWERRPGGEGDLTQYAAVQLFIERALDIQPGFAVTNENAPAVAEICARLDGLPLAIELAAARIRLFTPEALLARLSNRLAVLTGGARDLPARQQTIRNTIEWSYQLLDESEQRLFARLGVFVGGWTLEAAEAVCNATGDLPFDVLDGLAALLDKSLLKQEEGAAGEPRFSMLETICAYALERLEQSGELEAVRRQHAEHFLALAEMADAHLRRAGQGAWLDRLEAEHSNLRSALAWALSGADVELGCRLAVALAGILQDAPGFWVTRGYWREGYQWLELALSKSSGVAPTLRARLLIRFANFVGCLYSDEQAAAQEETLLAEALALFRTAGDTPGIAQTLLQQGTLLWGNRDSTRATRLLEESLAHYRELGDRRGSAGALHWLGDHARDRGDLAGAAALLEESVAIFRASDVNEAALADSLNPLGDVALLQGDTARATSLYWEAVLLLRNVGDRWTVLWPMRNLAWLTLLKGDDGRVRTLLEDHVKWYRDRQSEGLVELLHLLSALVSAQGDASRATALLREALALHQQFGRQDRIVESLDGCAWLATGQGQPARAARLLGAIESMLIGGAARYPAWRFAHNQIVAAARAQLDAATFDAAWAAGAVLTRDQAVAEALAFGDTSDVA